MAPLLRYPSLWRGLWWAGVGLLVLVCLIPLPTQVDLPIAGFDKAEHLLAFAALAWHAGMAFTPRRARHAAFAILMVVALAIECLQGLLPWRSAEVGDLLADALGVLLGMLLARSRAAGLLHWIEEHLHGSEP